MSVDTVNNDKKSDNDNIDNAQQPQSHGDDLSGMFMKLLVAQIKNQDPLNPTSGTEFVTQLSQMAQMETMGQMNNSIGNATTLMDNLQALAVGNLVGQSVMVRTDKVKLDGQSVNGRLTLEHPSNQVTVHIKDTAGNEKTIDLGKRDKGQVDFTIDPEALGLAPGEYTLSVVSESDEKKVQIELSGIINNVRIGKDGALMLNISGLGEIPFLNISEFGGKPAPVIPKV